MCHDDSGHNIFYDDVLDPNDGDSSDTYLDNTYIEDGLIEINHNNINLVEDNQNGDPIYYYLVDNTNDVIEWNIIPLILLQTITNISNFRRLLLIREFNIMTPNIKVIYST